MTLLKRSSALIIYALCFWMVCVDACIDNGARKISGDCDKLVEQYVQVSKEEFQFDVAYTSGKVPKGASVTVAVGGCKFVAVSRSDGGPYFKVDSVSDTVFSNKVTVKGGLDKLGFNDRDGFKKDLACKPEFDLIDGKYVLHFTVSFSEKDADLYVQFDKSASFIDRPPVWSVLEKKNTWIIISCVLLACLFMLFMGLLIFCYCVGVSKLKEVDLERGEAKAGGKKKKASKRKDTSICCSNKKKTKGKKKVAKPATPEPEPSEKLFTPKSCPPSPSEKLFTPKSCPPSPKPMTVPKPKIRSPTTKGSTTKSPEVTKRKSVPKKVVPPPQEFPLMQLFQITPLPQKQDKNEETTEANSTIGGDVKDIKRALKKLADQVHRFQEQVMNCPCKKTGKECDQCRTAVEKTESLKRLMTAKSASLQTDRTTTGTGEHLVTCESDRQAGAPKSKK